MSNYIQILKDAYVGYYNFLVDEITLSYDYKPLWENYFYLLILISVVFFGLELLTPWRKNQPKFRKDFWLDAFYMFFNFFIFSLIIFHAASDVVVNLFTDGLAAIGISNLLAIEVQTWPIWAHLVLGFFVRDFVQWWIHRLLHKSSFLWEFHKVHHSVEQMGFAAHLRYHWMENVVYKTLEYLPLALIGIGLNDFFIIHIFTLIVGHYNHANAKFPEWVKGIGFGTLIGLFAAFFAFHASGLGIVAIVGISAIIGLLASPIIKYIFNSPEMHIWHHAYDLPKDKSSGVNFGLTLSCWDYIFGTNHIPYSGRDIRLGFPGIEDFPEDFGGQLVQGWVPTEHKKKHSDHSEIIDN
jgi:sterol desaturase/sphingolipid hydroxylase (fatty acid hydroxylase superfamily)